jgi:hypothetical protein
MEEVYIAFGRSYGIKKGAFALREMKLVRLLFER